MENGRVQRENGRVQRENERVASITINYHLNVRDILIGQNFQVKYGKWSVLRCIATYSNILKKCLLWLYEELEIVKQGVSQKGQPNGFAIFQKLI